jgi:hypothetical protein
MKPVPRLAVSAVALVLMLMSSGPAAYAAEPAEPPAASHLLDGRTYAGQNGSKGMPADHDDTFIFANGTFHSTSCDPYGFGTGPYRATEADGVITFEAVTTSPTHGQITWHGTIRDDTLDATFVWTKERWYWDIRKEYWFKGKLQP